MTRDYAKRSAQKKKTKKKSSHFGLWLFVLLLFTTFTFGLVYLGKYKQQHPHPKASSPQKIVIHQQQKEITTKTTNTPKFDFYTLVPQKRNNNIIAGYELEIATVKDYTAADHLKAELTLLGFAVSIVPIREENIQKYYISVGPYNNKESATVDLERLKLNKISGKIKKTH